MPYETRIVNINLDTEEAVDFSTSIKAEYELQFCALAKDSLDEVRSWFPQQCQHLPTRQMKTWDARNKKTLIIFPNENFVKNASTGLINRTIGYSLLVALLVKRIF